MSEDSKLRELLVKATKDPVFREQFLKMPEETAKQMNAKIPAAQLEKIKWAASFISSLSNFRIWPGPIFYPIDSVMQQWAMQEMFQVISYRRPFGPGGPIFYPARQKILQMMNEEKI
jgi:hypothetical protein